MSGKRTALSALIVLGFSFFGLIASAQQPFLGKPYGFLKIPDLTYGTGTVNSTTSPTLADLKCDVYIPTGPNVPELVPAVILIHGGAYIVGDKDAGLAQNPAIPGDFGATMGVYAPEFAKRGYIAFSINYRMILDDPDGTGLLSTGGASLATTIAVIQGLISGAVTVPDDQVRRAVEAAVADTEKAYDFVVANKDSFLITDGFSIDTSRIAVGGWSAGGAISHDFAYAVPAKPVAAVWSNSAGMENRVVFITSASQPPSINFHGDADPIVDVSSGQLFHGTLESVGVPNQYFEMAGEDHYYLNTRPVFESPTRAGPGTSVERLVAEFFFEQMDLLPLVPVIPGLPASSNKGILALITILGAMGAFALAARMARQRKSRG